MQLVSYWPGAAFVARAYLVATGGKADAAGSLANDVNDPKRTQIPRSQATPRMVGCHLLTLRAAK